MTCRPPRLHLGLTESVCPVCLKTIPAERIAEGDTVLLAKSCPEHGSFAVPVWRGLDSWVTWGSAARAFARPVATATEVEHGCPQDCGLCPEHRQQSCCVLLEVTSRCNIACPLCFASAETHGADATLAEIDGWLETLAQGGRNVHVQLSGGEPTMRDDLPEIVARIRAAGFDFVQLNSNGIRIAREPAYLDRLAKAGLDCVFLQFDGVDDGVYERLRGAKLMRLKEQAIANCGAAGIGCVLVPTVVPGVNDADIGAILDFAVAHMPAVRAVHFQPVSWFGRYPDANAELPRITLPEIIAALIAHEGGTIAWNDFHPGSAENPYCSFSGRFRVDDDGRLQPQAAAQSCCGTPIEAVAVPASAPSTTGCCGGTAAKAPAAPVAAPASACCGTSRPKSDAAGPNAAQPAIVSSEIASPDVARARRYVAGQWRRPASTTEPATPGLDAFDRFLATQDRILGLSGMAFQDAWTLDLDRLRQCHIHVVSPDRRVVPFCAWNLTAIDGRPMHRPQHGQQPQPAASVAAADKAGL
ncbi:MAG: radical SAM protein [Ancalomicrobiaceae bacterium]|nr:radical SAM protein [Ancalomicrobiaceae bacterium]